MYFFSQIHKFLLFPPIDKRISVTGTSKRHFQQYFSYDMAVIGFIRGGKPIDKNFNSSAVYSPISDNTLINRIWM